MTKQPTNQPTDQLTDWFHGPKSLLSHWWFLSQSKNPHILWNPKVSTIFARTNPPITPILSQINPVHVTQFYVLKINFNTILLSTLCLPSALFASDVPTRTLHVSLLTPIRATCPAHLILLDLITWTILCEQYRSVSSSLCSLLHSLATSSLLNPNIFLSTLFSDTFNYVSPSASETKFHTHKNNRQNYSSVNLNLDIFR